MPLFTFQIENVCFNHVVFMHIFYLMSVSMCYFCSLFFLSRNNTICISSIENGTYNKSLYVLDSKSVNSTYSLSYLRILY